MGGFVAQHEKLNEYSSLDGFDNTSMAHKNACFSESNKQIKNGLFQSLETRKIQCSFFTSS